MKSPNFRESLNFRDSIKLTLNHKNLRKRCFGKVVNYGRIPLMDVSVLDRLMHLLSPLGLSLVVSGRGRSTRGASLKAPFRVYLSIYPSRQGKAMLHCDLRVR